jgi:hypothetical protein
MGTGMQPRTIHNFFLPAQDARVQLHWRTPRRPFKERFRSSVRQLLLGGPDPENPADQIDEKDFVAAFSLLEHDDIPGAEQAFSDLGYQVRVSDFRVPPHGVRGA